MDLDFVPHALGEKTTTGLATATQNFLGDPVILFIGIVLILGAVLLFYFLKKIVVNSVLGVIAWAILYYGLNVQLPFWASLIVSIIFGLAGVGVLLVLRFLGIL